MRGRHQILIDLILLATFLFFGCGSDESEKMSGNGTDTVSVSSELKKLYDLSDLPEYETSARSYQTSSYDTTGGNDDGFSGTYSFLRRNEDSTLVIFEAFEAGVINRFWTPTPLNDAQDFYIDDTDKCTSSK